jgi:hypothetical protein
MNASRLAAVLVALTWGCGGGEDTDGGAGGLDGDVADGAIDAGPSMRPDASVGCVVALPVDLLFVIDDSDSMAEEQANLIANFPELIRGLTNPPDEDGDGEPDVPPVDDLRIGIVSTDMGVGAASATGCDATGSEGALIGTSRSADPMCAGVTTGAQPWLEFRAGDDPDALAATFGCLAALGTGGCGLERQLDAARAAVTTAAAAGGPNEGFLRPNSLVGIVFVTDEDDCSAADEMIYDRSAGAALGPYGTRCAEHPELLTPVAEYVQAFANLRFDRDNDIVVAAITGVPFSAVTDPLEEDLEALLMDSRMQFARDPARPGQLVPACTTMITGSAIPARRIVEVIQPFAATDDGLAATICEDDLSPALNAVARLVARRICPPPI